MYDLSWNSGTEAEAVFQLAAAVATTDFDFEVHRSQGNMTQGISANGIEASHLDDFSKELLGMKKPEDFEGFAGVIVSQELLLHFGAGCFSLQSEGSKFLAAAKIDIENGA